MTASAIACYRIVATDAAGNFKGCVTPLKFDTAEECEVVTERYRAVYPTQHFAVRAFNAAGGFAEMPAAAAPAMVPTPCQQQQANAARKPTRTRRDASRRYVTVRASMTGETFRVLTSVAGPGYAIIEFTPSNRHRAGALNGMLITHDDITKAHVFTDMSECAAYVARGRKMGWGCTYSPAVIIADPSA